MPPDPVVDDDRELTFRAWYECWLDECEQRWLKWPDHILRDSRRITSLVWGGEPLTRQPRYTCQDPLGDQHP